MRLNAMGRSFMEQTANPETARLTFKERFGLIVDQQMNELENRRMKNRLKSAKLRLSAYDQRVVEPSVFAEVDVLDAERPG